MRIATWNVNSINTTVTVPDGGTGLLGGVNYAREGSVSRGVLESSEHLAVWIVP